MTDDGVIEPVQRQSLALAQQEKIARTQRRDDTVRAAHQRLNEWMQTAVRFIVLSNAGGAVATLSFIGVRMEDGGTPTAAVISLACFVFGVIAAGLVILGQLQWAWDDRWSIGQGSPPKGTWITSFAAWALEQARRLLYISFAGFGLGAVIGIMSLLF